MRGTILHVTVSTVDLDHLADEVARALEALQHARRRAALGLRAAGPVGDVQRAAVLDLVAEADEALYRARLTADRALRPAGLDGVRAPRPVIVLPA